MNFKKKRSTGSREPENGVQAGSYIWNSVGGILNAGQSVVVLMVITRVLGLDAAGIYSIAFATGNLFLYLGEYGVRNYQVSDLREEVPFRDYLAHRSLTVLLMLVLSIAFCLYNRSFGGYDTGKAVTVFAMCLLKVVDCMEEVFEGRLHQKGRLDLAGKVMTVRLIVSIGGMIAAVVLIKSLAAAAFLATVLAALSAGFMIFHFREELCFVRGKVSGANVAKLMRECLPVCASNFLSFYLVNAPKYAIDARMSSAAQAQYNFIAMPVFVIQLLNMFMYQPVLGRMTVSFVGGDKKAFLSDFFKIIGGLLAVSAVCLAGAYVLGIPVLSLLYATDLSALKTELLLILVGGIFLALCGFLSAVLTIMRIQRRIPLVYLAGTALSFILTGRMVDSFGIRGAVLAFLLIMMLVSAMLSALFSFALRRVGK